MDWKIIVSTILIGILAVTGVFFLGENFEFQKQDIRVIEQYEDQINNEKITLFIIYYEDKDTINENREIEYFNKNYPKYEIIDYSITTKVSSERIYDVMIIEAVKE